MPVSPIISTRYEKAGLSPCDLPPEELRDLVRELDHVFTSTRPRSHQSATALAPHAERIADPLFAEAPLAAPAIPLLQMRVSKWAVLSRLLWYVGFHPGIESPRAAAKRAAQAADILIARARKTRRRRAGGAWLFQLDDRTPACGSRFCAQRKPPGTLLE